MMMTMHCQLANDNETLGAGEPRSPEAEGYYLASICVAYYERIMDHTIEDKADFARESASGTGDEMNGCGFSVGRLARSNCLEHRSTLIGWYQVDHTFSFHAFMDKRPL